VAVKWAGAMLGLLNGHYFVSTVEPFVHNKSGGKHLGLAGYKCITTNTQDSSIVICELASQILEASSYDYPASTVPSQHILNQYIIFCRPHRRQLICKTVISCIPFSCIELFCTVFSQPSAL